MKGVAKGATVALLVLVVVALPFVPGAQAKGSGDWVKHWLSAGFGLCMEVHNEPPKGTPIFGFKAIFTSPAGNPVGFRITASPTGWVGAAVGPGIAQWTTPLHDGEPIHNHGLAWQYCVELYDTQVVQVTWFTQNNHGGTLNFGNFTSP